MAGPERRFAGVAPSASSSMKSRVMKSLVEKSSSEKLGPWGNKALEPETEPDSALSLALSLALKDAIVAAGPRGTRLVWGRAFNSSTACALLERSPWSRECVVRMLVLGSERRFAMHFPRDGSEPSGSQAETPASAGRPSTSARAPVTTVLRGPAVPLKAVP